MKRSYLYVVVVVIVLAVAGGAWYAADHKKNTNNNTNPMNTGSSNTNNSNQSPVATDKVDIQNFAFSPASVTVKKGTTVTWTNKDSVTHTVTETDSQAGPSSGDVNPGSSYSFTFNTPGTYHYHCSIHTEMVGTVTVTD